MSGMLLYDIPQSEGVKNLIARAKRISEFQWTPAQEICIKRNAGGWPFIAPAKNGKAPEKPKAITGIPYSSARIANKFVGIDITFDTFLTAAENPASILYQRDNSDFDDPNYNCRIGNTYFYYGTVCSAFADYVYDLPIHRCTYEWGTSQEFYEVLDGTPNCLRLGDCLLNNKPDGTVGGHIEVVTGIARDEQGNVRMVEISEGVTPKARSWWYTLPELNRILLTGTGTYRPFRYRFLDAIRPPEPMMSYAEGELMLNYGDFSNYQAGESVEININVEFADSLVIEGTSSKLEIPFDEIGTKTIQGNTYKMYCTDSLAPDIYIAYCVLAGKKMRPVHFIVYTLPQMKLTDTQGNAYGRITIKPVDPEGKPLTKESACFYQEDGTLKTGPVKIAMTDGERLMPAFVGIREQGGQLIARPAATLTDENGDPFITFRVGEDVTFYAFRAKADSVMRVYITPGEQCTPQYLSWTEERVVCHDQTLITANDLKRGYSETFVRKAHGNDFANLLLYSVNDFGTTCTTPITFVLD